MSRGNEFMLRGNEFMSRGNEFMSRGNEFMSRGNFSNDLFLPTMRDHVLFTLFVFVCV